MYYCTRFVICCYVMRVLLCFVCIHSAPPAFSKNSLIFHVDHRVLHRTNFNFRFRIHAPNFNFAQVLQRGLIPIILYDDSRWLPYSANPTLPYMLQARDKAVEVSTRSLLCLCSAGARRSNGVELSFIVVIITCAHTPLAPPLSNQLHAFHCAHVYRLVPTSP